MSLDLTGFGSVADLIKSGIDRIWPDKTKALEIKAQVDAAVLAGQLQEMQAAWDNAKAQIAVNAEEAKSQSFWVSGWRPYIGWVCGTAFAWTFLVQPFAVFLITAFHGTLDTSQLPELDTASIMQVLFGILGLGALRTYEKVKGAAK